jgi:hypothetical protein
MAMDTVGWSREGRMKKDDSIWRPKIDDFDNNEVPRVVEGDKGQCPVCDGNGYIKKTYVHPFTARLLVCNNCHGERLVTIHKEENDE